MAANIVGILAKLYRNSATFGSPTWDEVPIVRNLTMNRKWDNGEVITRASRAKKGVPTTIDLSLSGEIQAIPDNTDYLALRTAFLAGTSIDVLALTGAHSNNGEDGVRYEAMVEDMTQNQGADGALYDTFVLRPHAASTNAVQTALVATGAPVFTAI